jgi:hypothetical protein
MPLSDSHQLLFRDERPIGFAEHTRTSLLRHGERILAEVPATLRMVRRLMLVMAVAIPAFLVGLLVVLWRLA